MRRNYYGYYPRLTWNKKKKETDKNSETKMGKLSDVMKVLGIEKEFEILKNTGLSDFKVVGKVETGILGTIFGTDKIIVKPSSGNYYVIVNDNLIDTADEDFLKLTMIAKRINYGKVVIDADSMKIYIISSASTVVAGKKSMKLAIKNPNETPKIAETIRLLVDLSGDGVNLLATTLKEVNKVFSEVRNIIKASIIYAELDGDKVTVYIVIPVEGKDVAFKLNVDTAGNWVNVIAKILAEMFKRGLINEDDIQKISNDEIRKRVMALVR